MKKLKAQIKPVELFGKVNISLSSANGRLQAKTVYPSEERQEILPTDNHFALSAVYVEAAPLQSVTLNPSELMQNAAPDADHYGIGAVTVNPATLQEKTVTPGEVVQEITADEGYYGMKKVVVEAVTGGGGGEVMLQDLTVTPTDEVQTFYPDEGFDGFYSVTVEAAESSGGSGDSGEGGSGSGGDSGDDSGGGSSVTYPDVSNEYLGYSGTTGEVPTGYVSYWYNTASPSFVARFRMWPEKYRYQYAYSNKNGSTTFIYVYLSELPATYGDGSDTRFMHSATCKYAVYTYRDTDETWVLNKEGTVEENKSVWSFASSRIWNWQNYNIERRNDDYVTAKSAPLVYETTTQIVTVSSTYTANGADLNSVALVAKKITGNDNPMTFTQAVWALEDYAASLE